MQAHVARVQTIDDVEALVTALKSNNKIARATHNMLAYRIATQKAGTFLQDYDDDGETAAGSRMLHLLQVCSAHFHHFFPTDLFNQCLHCGHACPSLAIS